MEAFQPTTSPSPQAVKRRSLLDLPPEIRNLIYDEALSSGPHPPTSLHTPRTKHSKPDVPVFPLQCQWPALSMWKTGQHGRQRPVPQLVTGPKFSISGIALLRVNKQVHHEAAAVLYGNNRFALGRHAGNVFIRNIGQANVALIRHLHIYINVEGILPTALLRACTALQTLETSFDHSRMSFAWSRPEMAEVRMLDQIDKIHTVFMGASDLRTTLVVQGPRGSVSTSERLLPVMSRAKAHGWKIRRVEEDEAEEDFDPDSTGNPDEEGDA